MTRIPITTFALAIVLVLTIFMTATADYAAPIAVNQRTLFLTGTFPIDTTTIVPDQAVTVNYSISLLKEQQPAVGTPLDIEKAKFQIFQHALLLIEGDMTQGATKNEQSTKSSGKFPIEQFSLQKFDTATPLSFALEHKLVKTPAELGITTGSLIQVCIGAKQDTHLWFGENCSNHVVSNSALIPLSTPLSSSSSSSSSPQPSNSAQLTDRITSRTQTSFRAFCNGQTPPSPDNIFTPLPTTQLGCSTPERFHINAYGLNIATPTPPTLTFQIFGHAQVRKSDGTLNPSTISCRVNTHYVQFTRADQIEDEAKKNIYPEGQNIYVADDVDELTHHGVFELECTDTGLYYPIHYTDPTTQDRTTVRNIRYETFIRVTISDPQSLTTQDEWAQQPSFALYFDSPAIDAPVDIDFHSSSNMVKIQKIVSDDIDINMLLNQISDLDLATNMIDAPTLSSQTDIYNLSFFGTFYLTQTPHKSDVIQFCPLHITMTAPLKVLILQQNFNTTTNTTLPGSPIELLNVQIEKSTNEKDTDTNFLPTLCYNIPIFSQFPWRSEYTTTPQVLRFVIETTVSDYTPNSAIYGRYVRYNRYTNPEKPTDPLYIYAATPLPSHSTPFAAKVETNSLTYNAEEAEGYSTYSARLTTIKLQDISRNIDRLAIVLIGNHYLDGDIQCRFTYTNPDGDEIDDYISAKIDKTVQDARMVSFDLEDGPIDVKNRVNDDITLDCKGLFVTSYSAPQFNGKSILHIFGRDAKTHEFTLTTIADFAIGGSENAPQPQLPVQPDKKSDDSKLFKALAIGIGVVAIAGLIFIVVAIIRRRSAKKAQHGEALLNSDDYLTNDFNPEY